MLTIKGEFTHGDRAFQRGERIDDPALSLELLEHAPTHVIRRGVPATPPADDAEDADASLTENVVQH